MIGIMGISLHILESRAGIPSHRITVSGQEILVFTFLFRDLVLSLPHDLWFIRQLRT